jgi:DNA-binding CsgD family transcriptional regulator
MLPRWPEEDGWNRGSLRVRRLRPASHGASIKSEIAVLGCFSGNRPLTSQEIAERLNLSPDTVDAIAKHLVSLHCLEQLGPGAYKQAAEAQPPSGRAARPIRSLNEDVCVTVMEIRCATRTLDEQRHEPLRSFVLDERFAGSLARSPVEMRHVAYTILLIASGHPSLTGGSVPLPLISRARGALQPWAAWWRGLIGAGGLGIHYVELGNGTLEFLSVAEQHEQPDPAKSRARGVHG